MLLQVSLKNLGCFAQVSFRFPSGVGWLRIFRCSRYYLTSET